MIFFLACVAGLMLETLQRARQQDELRRCPRDLRLRSKTGKVKRPRQNGVRGCRQNGRRNPLQSG